MSGDGIPRICTPATAAPVVASVARPLIVRATGVGLEAEEVDGVALGVEVGIGAEIVGGATVDAGARVL